MRQPSSPTFFSWLSDHPLGQEFSETCLSLTASRIVTLILVALAASKSGWTLSNRSGKASANTCWNYSRMSAKTSQYEIIAGRQTPRVALKTGLSDTGLRLADDDSPRHQNLDQETMKRTIRPKTSSFWEKGYLSFLMRCSRPRKFCLKSFIRRFACSRWRSTSWNRGILILHWGIRYFRLDPCNSKYSFNFSRRVSSH